MIFDRCFNIFPVSPGFSYLYTPGPGLRHFIVPVPVPANLAFSRSRSRGKDGPGRALHLFTFNLIFLENNLIFLKNNLIFRQFYLIFVHFDLIFRQFNLIICNFELINLPPVKQLLSILHLYLPVTWQIICPMVSSLHSTLSR